MTKDFSLTEQKILDLFTKGTKFSYNGEDFVVVNSGKPRPHGEKGECKTDIYISALSKSRKREKEFKLSVKQKNADFLENKIKLDRAKEIFGENAQDIIYKSIMKLKDDFTEEFLICFDKFGKTDAHSIKLGWKFELVNSKNGKRTGLLDLTHEQKIDVFSGTNLSKGKCDSYIGEEKIDNSGVANYFIEINPEEIIDADTIMKKIIPIEDYAKTQNIYFACKALNYRFDEKKWDGDRPLSVYIKWSNKCNKLNGVVCFDNPLEHTGNEIGIALLKVLDELKIDSFDELETIIDDSVKCFRNHK